MPRLRVLNVVPDPRPGGATLRVLQVARALVPLGIETVALLADGEAGVAERFAAAGVPWTTAPISRVRHFGRVRSAVELAWHCLPEAEQIAAAASVHGCQVVHANGLWQPQAAAGARVAGLPCVWHLNDTLLSRLAATLARTGMHALGGRFVASSHGVARHYGLCDLPDSRILYPPVDVQAFRVDAVDRDAVAAVRQQVGAAARPLVVLIGNVNPLKGVDTLLTARREMPRGAGSPVVAVVGQLLPSQGAYITAVRAEVARAKLSDDFLMVGGSADVRPWLAAADLAVCPSRSEAFGMAAVEASAMERAVIVSDAGGMPETVQDGVTGCVVRRDDPAALAHVVDELLRDPARRAAMGRAGREYVGARFSLEAAAQRHARVYRSLVSVG